ncbi:MAG: lipopolysaccharide heptosyltransferase family protein [Spirobacillus cienkowskii]|jgi:heptosyltransferase-3|uniref:Lipopolysaccharide heptosyltransferase family protein n=1 Tax=Spirobacillus cienkowskii TaxID=495820 RepID=A0A369KQM1_9BACT|nr:MAG: lipopolysaccharide heptosyltransferase family protein [Spirobacillus cienkowskii]
MMEEKKILISRIDNIGDVVLTLPIAGAIKEHFPNSKIFFLGKSYTKPIIESCSHIDCFLDWDQILSSNNFKLLKNNDIDTVIHVFPNKKVSQLSKEIAIKTRIGTNRRFFHWLYCNKFVNLSRKNSSLHEAQLNLKLLKPIGIKKIPTLKEIPNYYGLNKIKPLPGKFLNLLDNNKFKLILHPKSKGSAREWGINNFIALANLLPKDKFQVFFSGNKEESNIIKNQIIPNCLNCIDVSNLFNLEEFISFIFLCDGLVANSTGPLHIAAALGKHTIGLYPPIESMSVKRWGPIGKKAQFITGIPKNNSIYCNQICSNQNSCLCMASILPNLLKENILKWYLNN